MIQSCSAQRHLRLTSFRFGAAKGSSALHEMHQGGPALGAAALGQILLNERNHTLFEGRSSIKSKSDMFRPMTAPKPTVWSTRIRQSSFDANFSDKQVEVSVGILLELAGRRGCAPWSTWRGRPGRR